MGLAYSTKFGCLTFQTLSLRQRRNDIHSSTPSRYAGGCKKMNYHPILARQAIRQPWPHEKLISERALTLSFAIDSLTQKCYGSACNAYLNFTHNHKLPIDPTS